MAGMSDSVVAVAATDGCGGSKVEVATKQTACRKRDRRDESACVAVAERTRERMQIWTDTNLTTRKGIIRTVVGAD